MKRFADPTLNPNSTGQLEHDAGTKRAPRRFPAIPELGRDVFEIPDRRAIDNQSPLGVHARRDRQHRAQGDVQARGASRPGVTSADLKRVE